MKQISVLIGFLACLIAAGCSTPSSVLDLADKSAGSVALLNKYISSFTANQQDLTSQRIAISADQAESFAELAARNQRRIDEMRLSGMNDEVALITNIIAASESATATENQLLLVNSNEVRVLQASQIQLKSYSKDLNSLSGSLSQLAKDDSLETRVDNLVVFAQAVKTDMDSANSKSAAASQAMKTNATQLKASTDAEVSALSR